MDITTYKFYKNLTELPFIEEIWLFGSRARGDNQDRADIDLAIYCPKAEFQDWSKVLDIIDEADTLLKIDCLRLDKLDNSAPIKTSIMTEGIKLYDRNQN